MTLGAGLSLRLVVSEVDEGDVTQRFSGRLAPTLDEERTAWASGCRCVAGLDEAGRGAWAGPVVAAAVILPPEAGIADYLAGVTDSKQLSAPQRERLAARILACAAGSGVGQVPAGEIDVYGIAEATRMAMHEAVQALSCTPDLLLIDYIRLPLLSIRQRSLPKGDSRVLSIAAASILAKVTRDRLMVELAADYPGYGFERHKGYGTADHRDALRRLGPCPVHRLSFQPLQGQQLALFVGLSPAEVSHA